MLPPSVRRFAMCLAFRIITTAVPLVVSLSQSAIAGYIPDPKRAEKALAFGDISAKTPHIVTGVSSIDAISNINIPRHRDNQQTLVVVQKTDIVTTLWTCHCFIHQLVLVMSLPIFTL